MTIGTREPLLTCKFFCFLFSDLFFLSSFFSPLTHRLFARHSIYSTSASTNPPTHNGWELNAVVVGVQLTAICGYICTCIYKKTDEPSHPPTDVQYFFFPYFLILLSQNPSGFAAAASLYAYAYNIYILYTINTLNLHTYLIII